MDAPVQDNFVAVDESVNLVAEAVDSINLAAVAVDSANLVAVWRKCVEVDWEKFEVDD